jgi:hypothetical protein
MWLWWGSRLMPANKPTLKGRAHAESRLEVIKRVLVVFDLEPSFSAAADLPVAFAGFAFVPGWAT